MIDTIARPPIVLAHGLFGFSTVGYGRLVFSSYFRHIPNWLRAAGHRVLVTRVHPTAGIRRRGKRLGDRILAAFPDEPVHIIGHSMGGLDARALLAEPGWTDRVLSLTTIATPHLGSPLADFAKLRMGRVYGLLERLGIDYRGFLDITRREARAFNRAMPQPTEIPCFSIGGNPAHADVCWPLRRLHEVVYELEGPNDGLVSQESAEAFGTPLPAWPLDHLRQMNWMTSHRADPEGSEVARLYLNLVDSLAAYEPASALELEVAR